MLQSFRLRGLASLTLAFGLLVTASTGLAQESGAPQEQQPVVQRRIGQAAREGSLPFARTELFSGTGKPDGVVTEEDFRAYTESSPRIDRLRRLYKKRFQRESVLRVDDPFVVWVSF